MKLQEAILNRQSIFPKDYIKKDIPLDLIADLLRYADRAPTHKKTEPWRFIVLKHKKKDELGHFLAEEKKQIAGQAFSIAKYEKTIQKAQQSDTILLICMQRDPKERIPEWEEIAAVAMAVQNIWLACTAKGIGAYWSSPKTIDRMGKFIELGEGQRCLGVFYMGYTNVNQVLSEREDLEDKIEWFIE